MTANRAVALFFNFLLVILAYYQVKAASRSLLVEFGGTAAFPYVWIASALVLLAFIGVYNGLVARFSRVRIVVSSLIIFALALALFRVLMSDGGIAAVIAFYIFVDIFSVVLVEQFWSLSNTVNRSDEGKRSYWLIGTGGLVGGVSGGILASVLLKHTPMHTVDLLISCAVFLLITAVMTVLLWRRGLFNEVTDARFMTLNGDGLRAIVKSRYLSLIAVIICLSQLAEPIVEYQFLTMVSEEFTERDARTAYISGFLSLLGAVSIGVNLVITPLVHRYLGIVAGLLVQPLVLSFASLGLMFNTSLVTAGITKICDRGLSYSINRASKELLYIPVDPVNTYQTKAWIDMLGYRMFKVLGAGLILLATQWTPLRAGTGDLSWLTLGVCIAWTAAVMVLALEYRVVAAQTTA